MRSSFPLLSFLLVSLSTVVAFAPNWKSQASQTSNLRRLIASVIEGEEFRVSSFTNGEQSFPTVTSPTDGGFVITWMSDGEDGSSSGIYMKHYSPTGTLYGAKYRVNTRTSATQANPVIASLSGGSFVIAWQSDGQDGSGYGVYAQCYRKNNTVGSEFRANSYTTIDQNYPSIAGLTDGGFVIAWTSSQQDGSTDGVYLQRFTSNAEAYGSEERVNTYTLSYQEMSSIAGLSSGGYVITWMSKNEDGSGYGIFAQHYTFTGSRFGSEFRVNTHTADQQYHPAIASLPDGGFVITWMSQYQDGSGWGIYAQRYSADNSKYATEFRVNTVTMGDQLYPAIASLSDGGFVITWTSEGQDGSGYGIYAQCYTSLSAVNGSEFQVNTYTNGDQTYSTVASAADGSFLITWMSKGQDSLGNSIYAKMFNAVPPRTPTSSPTALRSASSAGDSSAIFDSQEIFLIVIIVGGVLAILLLGVCVRWCCCKKDSVSSLDGSKVMEHPQIIKAVMNGDIDTVNVLIRDKVDLNVQDAQGNTAVMVAAELGYNSILELLIKNNAGVDMKNNDGNTAVTLAVLHSHCDTVKMLLAAGANINITNKLGKVALSYAFDNGHVEIARLFTAKDINRSDLDVHLLSAAENGKYELVNALVTLSSKNIRDSDGNTLMMIAARKGNLDTVKHLLELEADFDAVNSNLDSALILATRYGHESIVQVLVRAGADTTLQNSLGQIAGDEILTNVSNEESIQIRKLLVEKQLTVAFEKTAKIIMLTVLDENTSLQRQEELLETLTEFMQNSQILKHADIYNPNNYEHTKRRMSLVDCLVENLNAKKTMWNRGAFNKAELEDQLKSWVIIWWGLEQEKYRAKQVAIASGHEIETHAKEVTEGEKKTDIGETIKEKMVETAADLITDQVFGAIPFGSVFGEVAKAAYRKH